MNGTSEATRKSEVERVRGGGKTSEHKEGVSVKGAHATVRLPVRVSALPTPAVTPGKSTSLCLGFQIREMGEITVLSLCSCSKERS